MAVHGFVSGVIPIVQGRDLLSAREWAGWKQCIAETVIATAMRMDGMANWRPTLDVPPGSTDKRLMQLCHGAPGFVIGLGDFPAGELDEVLLGAAEAIWAAGPLAKGSNLCHGTAGNGYAFLKLFARTGDERWLARARAFAMHGIDQTQRDAQRYGADALLAVDRRSRVRDLPVGLPPRRGPLPDAGRVLRRASLDRGACRQGRSGGRAAQPTDGAPRAPCQRHNPAEPAPASGRRTCPGRAEDAPARQVRAVEEDRR